jgi:hypothetical protein
MLLTRISTLGAGRMPPLATTVADTQAIALVTAWITGDLPGYQTFADWQMAWFGATNTPDAGPGADPDGDQAANELEFVTGTNPTNSLDAWSIHISSSNGVPVVEFPQIANRAFEIQSAPVLPGEGWTPLDVPGNEPFFSVSNRAAAVPDPASSGASRFYRVRVYGP